MKTQARVSVLVQMRPIEVSEAMFIAGKM